MIVLTEEHPSKCIGSNCGDFHNAASQIFMQSATATSRFRAVFMALLMGYLGIALFMLGYPRLRDWQVLQAPFALCVLIWVISGPIIVAAALWILLTSGRRRASLWIGGIAAAVDGTTLVAGVLTHVVPCAGPG